MSKPDINSVPLSGISIDQLKDFKIETKVGKADGRSFGSGFGRRFTLVNKDGVHHSEEVILKDIFNHVRTISKDAKALQDFIDIKNFLLNLAEADREANKKYEKAGGLYKFRTWFHRFPDLGKPHVLKIMNLIHRIDKTYPKIVINELKTLDKKQIESLHWKDRSLCCNELIKDSLENQDPTEAYKYIGYISNPQEKEELAMATATLFYTKPNDPSQIKGFEYKKPNSCVGTALNILKTYIIDDNKRDDELLKLAKHTESHTFQTGWIIKNILFDIKSSAKRESLMQAKIDYVLAVSPSSSWVDSDLKEFALNVAQQVPFSGLTKAECNQTMQWLRANILPQMSASTSKDELEELLKDL